MNPALALLAPLALILPGAAGVTPAGELPQRAAAGSPDPSGHLAASPAPASRNDKLDEGIFGSIAQSFRAPVQGQVRIEQRLTIRISPRPPVAMDMFDELPAGGMAPRMIERKMGRCLPISAIAGVQPSGDRKLMLFMRDQRVVSATLEKACRSRDFYSGFLIARNGDGLLCTDRDELQSRAGVNCRVSAMKQLIQVDD